MKSRRDARKGEKIMIVEFRNECSIGGVILDANELIKLMEFVREYMPRDCTTRVRDEFERIVVETTDGKLLQVCLNYDPIKTEETR